MINSINSNSVELSISYNDPDGYLNNFPLLNETIRAAINYLDNLIVFKGGIEIDVNFSKTFTGRFSGGGDISYVGMIDGKETWEPSILAESRSGVDPNPKKPDFSIYIDPTSDYINNFWWDPEINFNINSNPPPGKTDAFSVILHELIHGLGVNGWRNNETGLLPKNYQSTWDSKISITDSGATFIGTSTLSLLGQPAEIRLGGTQGAFHLGKGPKISDSAMPWIEASNLNGYVFYYGERYTLGRLELSILEDLGWKIKPTSLTDVVNLWDDKTNERYIVGWDTDEKLTGGVLSDIIEGRGGNDVLTGEDGNDILKGGSGDDFLNGGLGTDSAIYSSARGNYTINPTSKGFKVLDSFGVEGADDITNIERLKFSDQSVGLDIGGVSGQAYRLYKAAFDRVPDLKGLGYWINEMDNGASLQSVARGFIDSKEFQGLYGANYTNHIFLTNLYNNVLDREPDQIGYNYWINEMTQGMSRESVLANFSESHENIANVAGMITNGVSFYEWIG